MNRPHKFAVLVVPCFALISILWAASIATPTSLVAQTPAPAGGQSLNEDASKKIFGSVLIELKTMVPGEIEAGSELG